ncbi:MAG: xanthine dehydrogenase accessory protein XdhC [Pseudomonadota bacterium]|nr:xanthine dehydrogenase accessory protein XdhC [Pseudomonadota bacterium]
MLTTPHLSAAPLEWLHRLPTWLAAGQAMVLVSVARADGSTPREVGATMLVSLSAQADTIGGGHLEWQALQIARQWLQSADATAHPKLQRFNLSASLGQCCGGVMWLVFERLACTADNLARAQHWQQQIRAGHALKRCLSSQQPQSIWQIHATDYTALHQTNSLIQHNSEHWQFEQWICPPNLPIWLFGAGHVAEALIHTLLPLGAKIHWVDSREHAFPTTAEADYPAVTCIQTDSPETEVAQIAAHSLVLIMTHDHALDLQLCYRALQREDLAFVGMIGSRSKRAVFDKRLRLRGLTLAQCQRLVCPIGIAGISSKQPAVIAIAVAAQLLQWRDQVSPYRPPQLITKQLSAANEAPS